MVSYLPAIGEAAIVAWRWVGVTGPSWLDGGRMKVRSTMVGTPLGSSTETSASPLPNSVIAFSVLNFGLARNVVAAALTAC